MTQTILMTMIALAGGEIAKRYEEIMKPELLAQKVKGRATMATAAVEMGLSAREGEKAYDDGFPQLLEDLRGWIAEQAEIEIKQAVDEAEEEAAKHASYLEHAWRDHDHLMQQLADRQQNSVPEDADEEFKALIKSSDEAMAQRAEQGFRDIMRVVQMRHRLTIEYCFTKHLVPPATAKKLADYYEVTRNK